LTRRPSVVTGRERRSLEASLTRQRRTGLLHPTVRVHLLEELEGVFEARAPGLRIRLQEKATVREQTLPELRPGLDLLQGRDALPKARSASSVCPRCA